MTMPGTENFTELVDADIPRVDLVGKAANGTSFLLRKAADDGLLQPLVPAEQVRALLAKADAEPVAKDAPPVEVGEIMPPAPGGSTAESLPGSPDWEQLDGDTAMNAVAVLGRVKSVLCWLSDREATEAVTGDGDPDADGNSWDLDSMACNVDYLISCLAGFAAGEHLEAGMADELDAVGKGVAAVAGPLAALEGFVPVAKAGRTLSAANETKIRTAVDSLTEVLNSLPAAPAADDGAAVTKETAVPEQTAPEVSAAEPVDVLAKALAALPRLDAAQTAATLLAGGRTQEVAKAKGDPQMAVFSADGQLVGVIDPADLNPIAATEAPSEGDTEGSGDAQPADDATPAEPAEPADEPAERTVPGTSTVQAPPQAPDDTQTPAVAKTADPAALEEDRVAALAKQVADLAADNEVLKEQVRKFGMQPDDRRSPVLNGGTGVAGAATRGSSSDDKFADLRKAVEEAKTPSQRTAAQSALTYAEIAASVNARFQG